MTKPFAEPIEGTDDEPLFQTERWFPPDSLSPPGYRVPLPPGSYQVVLSLAEIDDREAGKRIVDVGIERTKVRRGYGPGAAGFARAPSETVEVRVKDGTLDVVFARGRGDPKVSAIEVRAAGSVR